MPTLHESRTAPPVRFGSFELNQQRGELRRAGVRLRLQAQPFRMLCVLVERAGEVVSREELQHCLWGSDTTVDFDHGLDVAVNKLRDVLEDSADNPQYIETFARRGYRFVGIITTAEAAQPPTFDGTDTSAESTWPPQSQVAFSTSSRSSSGHSLLFVAAVAALLLPVWIFQSRPHPLPIHIREMTDTGRVYPGFALQESLAQTATDGSRLFFPQIENGQAVLAQASIGDGETSLLPFSSPGIAPLLDDISPDGSRLLIHNQLSREAEGPLWIVPALGGSPQPLHDVVGHDATWMPGGQKILFASGTDLFVSSVDGSGIQKLASLPGRAFWLRWSSDGTLLRFTLVNALNHVTSLWEMSADGKSIRPLLPAWSHPESECCGSWTSDGRYFLFQSRHSGQNNIWALDQGGLLTRFMPQAPFQITNGPLSYQAPVAGRAGHEIFFLGLDARSELLQYDPASALFLPANNTLGSAQYVRYSRDGRWVAWLSLRGSTLWRSRTDGSERLQLTGPALEIYMMEWSADASHLVLMAREPGKLWRLYELDADGGNLHPLLDEQRNEADPSWTPHADAIVFGRPPDIMAERSQDKAIYLLDLKSGTFQTLPGSNSLFSPRCSPDGRYIAALPLGQRALMILDRTSGVWKMLAAQPAADPSGAVMDAQSFFTISRTNRNPSTAFPSRTARSSASPDSATSNR
jgi:DNA-binding winged helix-turn-helix (wHTH) protein/Tol biopolymer transport system component